MNVKYVETAKPAIKHRIDVEEKIKHEELELIVKPRSNPFKVRKTLVPRYLQVYEQIVHSDKHNALNPMGTPYEELTETVLEELEGEDKEPKPKAKRKAFTGIEGLQAYNMPPWPPNMTNLEAFKNLLLSRKSLVQQAGEYYVPGSIARGVLGCEPGAEADDEESDGEISPIKIPNPNPPSITVKASASAIGIGYTQQVPGISPQVPGDSAPMPFHVSMTNSVPMPANVTVVMPNPAYLTPMMAPGAEPGLAAGSEPMTVEVIPEHTISTNQLPNPISNPEGGKNIEPNEQPQSPVQNQASDTVTDPYASAMPGPFITPSRIENTTVTAEVENPMAAPVEAPLTEPAEPPDSAPVAAPVALVQLNDGDQTSIAVIQRAEPDPEPDPEPSNIPPVPTIIQVTV